MMITKTEMSPDQVCDVLVKRSPSEVRAAIYSMMREIELLFDLVSVTVVVFMLLHFSPLYSLLERLI